MLAATSPTENQPLDLFVFALTLISRGEPDVPDSLNQYLGQVLHQAMDLVSTPDKPKGPVLAEAVQLALQIKDDLALRAVISTLKEKRINADAATRLLVAVEQALVS